MLYNTEPTYRELRPNHGPARNPDELIALFTPYLQGGHIVILHPADAAQLQATSPKLQTLKAGGPQRGHIWLPLEIAL